MNRTRVYMPDGTVSHVLPWDGSANARAAALCGRAPWPGDWHGTGAAGEYERAAELPLCVRCKAVLIHEAGGQP